MSRPSIARRVTAALIITQVIALPVAAYWVWFGSNALELASNTDAGQDVGQYFAVKALARSLRPAPDGKARIDPAQEIADYAAQNPSFGFAAFDASSREPFQGSSTELLSTLEPITPYQPKSMNFSLDDARGRRRKCHLHNEKETPVGEVGLIVCGYAFDWRQVPSMLLQLLRWTFDPGAYSHYIPVFLASAAVSWIMIRRSLTPLIRTVSALKHVDAHSLHSPIPADHVPVEIFPLVEAFNGALSRIDAGVSRQRRFVANAAHELRTPVAVLNARVDGPKNPTFEQDLKYDVRRIRNLFEQLLAASRLDELPDEAGLQVDLVGVAQAQVSDNLLLAIKSGKQIELEAPSSPIIVHGSSGAIQSVLGNLIDNAVRAEPQGGTVIVRLSADRIIEVVDHGEGVAAPDREVIFEPFWRKSGSTTVGTGLGLSIVKEIMEKLEGRVGVEETPGGGATFKLSFPPVETVPEALTLSRCT